MNTKPKSTRHWASANRRPRGIFGDRSFGLRDRPVHFCLRRSRDLTRHYSAYSRSLTSSKNVLKEPLAASSQRSKVACSTASQRSLGRLCTVKQT